MSGQDVATRTQTYEVPKLPDPDIWLHPEGWIPAKDVTDSPGIVSSYSPLGLTAATVFENLVDTESTLPNIKLVVNGDHLQAAGWASYAIHSPEGKNIGYCNVSWNTRDYARYDTAHFAEIVLGKTPDGYKIIDSGGSPLAFEDVQGKGYGLAAYFQVISQALCRGYVFESYRNGLSKHGNHIWSILEAKGVARKTFSTDEVNENEHARFQYTRNQYEILSAKELAAKRGA